MEAINTGYIIFTNEDGYRSDARRAVMQRVCLPLLRACSEQVLRDFFLKHICDIITILEARESRVSLMHESYGFLNMLFSNIRQCQMLYWKLS